ncbi:MutL protein [Treponema primitia ZAS-2]|uniref:MutL protein n=1 Tax=Treponema primitia (strain ATCC BAA-887 / DSM 12427 / ZAS-2) TaxID=545694 RepID=F5YRD3_TREPZ|nr:methylaspartate mutase accessory protein GlmL [Treponema primitia]AEF86757.1 MutL protein [Treponema primitia ZAS-2]
MEAVLLIDFGSTNTKVTGVDLAGERLLGTAAAYTTVESDVGQGLAEALEKLQKETGPITWVKRYACSSAAGGLRMVTSGLVPALTAEASRLASLGAGAKVIRVFSYEMTDEDAAEIAALKPDIFLLSGGVDGGNKDCILHNAKILASVDVPFPVIVAGNRAVAGECEKILAATGRETIRCPNVMPQLNKLNIEPVQDEIRRLFLKRIIQAKGLSREQELISGILMPTPSAVKKAMELLAWGTEKQRGIGELVAVDLGGATTDVYSVAKGSPQSGDVVMKGLPEPESKRTVEGDLGMRYSSGGVLEALGADELAGLSGLSPEKVSAGVEYLGAHPDFIPADADGAALDFGLAAGAVDTAVSRHAGTIEEVYTPMGQVFVQTGKDLTGVRRLVLTGGAVIHNQRAGEIASHALYNKAKPASLRPRAADIYIDKSYILAAMGLLAEAWPDTALSIMRKEIQEYGTGK